jgi:hypothetical protein
MNYWVNIYAYIHNHIHIKQQMQAQQPRSTYAARFQGTERGYSVRNSGEIESFVREQPHGVGDDEINHFVFLACHAARPLHVNLIDVQGNLICFNYTGLPSIGVSDATGAARSPSLLRNNFFATLHHSHNPINKMTFYRDVLLPFKEANLAAGSPISLYVSGEGYQIADLYVLGNGHVFADEINHHPPSYLKENPASLYMVSFDRTGRLVGNGLVDLLAPGRLDVLRERPDLGIGLDIVNNFASGECVLAVDGKMTRDPYVVRTFDAGGNPVYRNVLLSDVFNIVRHAIHPYWYNQAFNPERVSIEEYMKKHLVLTTNGCRCIQNAPLCRTDSSNDPQSILYDGKPRGGTIRPRPRPMPRPRRKCNRKKSVKNIKNKCRNKKKTHRAKTY